MRFVTHTQSIRHLIQGVAFLLSPGLFILLFSAMKEIVMAVAGGTFTGSAYGTQILFVVGTLLVTAILGRFFCGYLCAFGALGDLLWAVSSRIRKRPAAIGKQADKVLKKVKYIVLLGIVGIGWILAVPIDSTYDPWAVFGIYSSLKGWKSLGALWSVGGLLLAFLLIGSLWIERFFCRYLCPLGAVFAPLSRFRLYQMKKPGSQCGECSMCTRSCSMGIPLKKMDRGRTL